MQNNNFTILSWNRDKNFNRFTNMAYIDEGGYGVVNPADSTNIEGFHTNNISMCVSIAIQNEENGKIFFAHVNSKHNNFDSLMNIIKKEGFNAKNSKFYLAYNKAQSSKYTEQLMGKLEAKLPFKIFNTKSAAFGITLDGIPNIPNVHRDNTTKNGRTFYTNQSQELHGLYHQSFCQNKTLLDDCYEINKKPLIKQFDQDYYIGDDGAKLKPQQIAFYRDVFNGGDKVPYRMNQNNNCCIKWVDYLKGHYIDTQISLLPITDKNKSINSNLFEDKNTKKEYFHR